MDVNTLYKQAYKLIENKFTTNSGEEKINLSLHKTKVISEDDDFLYCVDQVIKIPKTNVEYNIEVALEKLYLHNLENGTKIPSNARDGKKEVVLEKLRNSRPELFI